MGIACYHAHFHYLDAFTQEDEDLRQLRDEERFLDANRVRRKARRWGKRFQTKLDVLFGGGGAGGEHKYLVRAICR